MLKLIKHLLTAKSIYIALFCSILILIFSLIPTQSKLLGAVENSDKILHIFSYTLLSLTWLFYFKSINKLNIKFLLAIGIFFYGIIIEVLQSTLTTYRTGSLYDVVANIIGIFIALIIFENLYKLIFLKKIK